MCELLIYAIVSELASTCASDYVIVLLVLEMLINLQVVICSSIKDKSASIILGSQVTYVRPSLLLLLAPSLMLLRRWLKVELKEYFL